MTTPSLLEACVAPHACKGVGQQMRWVALQVRELYLELLIASQEASRTCLIDASQGLDQVASEVRAPSRES